MTVKLGVKGGGGNGSNCKNVEGDDSETSSKK